MDILVGADPELFVVNQDGNFRSAWNMIPGTKKDPFKVDKGAVQVDGFALEFNIEPASTAKEFVTNIKTVMAELKEMLPKGYNFAIVPAATFNAAHFKAQPEEAKELGCEPDYNAYTLEANPRPDNRTTMRTAGGHTHIGFIDEPDPSSEEHKVRCATLIKQMDAYLGIPSLAWDRNTKRRAMYGAAGAFRPKSYGVEYRSLSNAWIKDERLMTFVFDQTVKAVRDLLDGKRPWQDPEVNIQRAINLSDTYTARHFVGKHFSNNMWGELCNVA